MYFVLIAFRHVFSCVVVVVVIGGGGGGGIPSLTVGVHCNTYSV